MTRDQIRARFRQEASILDQCLAAGGGSYLAPSYADAVVFRHRCYTFMRKFAEAEPGPSPFDALIIRSLPPKRLVANPEAEISLRIDIRTVSGTFTPDREVTREADPLLDVAGELAKKLGL